VAALAENDTHGYTLYMERRVVHCVVHTHMAVAPPTGAPGGGTWTEAQAVDHVVRSQPSRCATSKFAGHAIGAGLAISSSVRKLAFLGVK